MWRNKRFSRLAGLFLVIVLPSTTLASGVFKWTDKDGKTHYSTSRPPEERVETHEPDPIDWRSRVKRSPAPANIRPHIPDPESPGPRHSAPITLKYIDVDIASLFEIFADFAKHRLDIDPAIHWRVSVNYVDAPWETTMQTIAAEHGLNVVRENGVIIVRRR